MTKGHFRGSPDEFLEAIGQGESASRKERSPCPTCGTICDKEQADVLTARYTPLSERGSSDAARYRWLNRQDNFIAHIEKLDRTRHYRLKCGDVLDKWIDERIAEERSAERKEP